MRRIGLTVLIAFVFGCSSHSAALPPIGAHSVSPFINQGQGQSRWLTFVMSQNVAGIARGHDDAMWLTGANQIVHVDMSGNEHDFSLNGSPNFGPITPNPDGNMYFAENYGTQYAIGQITPAGVVTDFPIGGTNGFPAFGVVESMTSGSDGAIWMVRYYFTQNSTTSTIVRMTTTGALTEYQTGQYQVSMIQRGPDKNLWVFGSIGFQTFMLKVSVVDGSYTVYSLPGPNIGRPVLGSDGAFWMGSGFGDGKMYRMDTSGNVTSYPTGLQSLAGPTTAGPNKKIYIYDNPKIYEWSIPKLRISQIKSPAPRNQPIYAVAIGPDDQLWSDDGHTNMYVLILHSILTTPSSVDVSQGSSQPLTVIEKKSTQRSFTAVSNDPTIATVSGSGRSFTVTGVAHGSTTITVSDQIGNSLDVSVTVN